LIVGENQLVQMTYLTKVQWKTLQLLDFSFL